MRVQTEIYLRGGGTFKMDDKSRLVMPASFVEGNPQFVACKGFEKNLYVFYASTWNELDSALLAKPFFDRDVTRIQRFLCSDVIEFKCDQQRRFSLTPELSEWAGLKPGKECKIIGCARWIEIWDKERYDTFIQKELEDDLQSLAARVWGGDHVETPTRPTE